MVKKKIIELTETQQARFDKCWAIYPRRDNGKGQAQITWSKYDFDEEMTEKIFQGILSLNIRKKTKEMSNYDRSFLPHFSTWLNTKGWVFDPVDEEKERPRSERNCFCGQPRAIKDYCIKCYELKTRLQIPVTHAERKYAERLNKLNEWIAKKNYATKEGACRELLMRKGILNKMLRHLA